jgi:hypothetical protein
MAKSSPAPTQGGGQPKPTTPVYCPPKGPIMNPPGPGIGGGNSGNSGTQGKR